MSIKDKVVRWAIVRWLNGQVKEGTVIGKVWQWFDGRKTKIGVVITIVSYVVGGIPLVAGLCNTAVCVATVGKASGIGLTVVGLLHKGYKFIYREEHKD